MFVQLCWKACSFDLKWSHVYEEMHLWVEQQSWVCELLPCKNRPNSVLQDDSAHPFRVGFIRDSRTCELRGWSYPPALLTSIEQLRDQLGCAVSARVTSRATPGLGDNTGWRMGWHPTAWGRGFFMDATHVLNPSAQPFPSKCKKKIYMFIFWWSTSFLPVVNEWTHFSVCLQYNI